MRVLLSLAALGAVALPGAALAQADVAAAAEVGSPPILAPLPTVQPTVEAPAPLSARPPPAPVDEALVATPPTGPTTVAPVIVAKESNDIAGKVGVIAGGVAGGAAGAALGGPVGKFAGGFLGKRLMGGLFGGKDKVPEITVVDAAPSAEAAGTAAVADPATAPPLKAKVANR